MSDDSHFERRFQKALEASPAFQQDEFQSLLNRFLHLVSQITPDNKVIVMQFPSKELAEKVARTVGKLYCQHVAISITMTEDANHGSITCHFDLTGFFGKFVRDPNDDPKPVPYDPFPGGGYGDY